jgi:hypothetical protein
MRTPARTIQTSIAPKELSAKEKRMVNKNDPDHKNDPDQKKVKNIPRRSTKFTPNQLLNCPDQAVLRRILLMARRANAPTPMHAFVDGSGTTDS